MKFFLLVSFALFGSVIFLYSFIIKRSINKKIFLLVVGSFFISLAVLTRQYYISLIPATILIIIVNYIYFKKDKNEYYLRLLFSLFCFLPIFILFYFWGGLTSPGMSQGTSYDNYVAKIGLNNIRFFSNICIKLGYFFFINFI